MKGFTLFSDWIAPGSGNSCFLFSEFRLLPYGYHVPPGGKKSLGERRSRHQMIGSKNSTTSFLDARLSNYE